MNVSQDSSVSLSVPCMYKEEIWLSACKEHLICISVVSVLEFFYGLLIISCFLAKSQHTQSISLCFVIQWKTCWQVLGIILENKVLKKWSYVKRSPKTNWKKKSENDIESQSVFLTNCHSLYALTKYNNFLWVFWFFTHLWRNSITVLMRI